jgi:hypothetical protein
MTREMGFHVIDATLSIEDQQQQMRDIVQKKFGKSLRAGALHGGEGESNESEAALTVL